MNRLKDQGKAEWIEVRLVDRSDRRRLQFPSMRMANFTKTGINPTFATWQANLFPEWLFGLTQVEVYA